MVRKSYVIDTNVLLHDPNAIEKFVGNDVVIPFVVLEELEKKCKFSDELGKNARDVLRFIGLVSSRGDLSAGVKVKNDVVLYVARDISIFEKTTFPLVLDNPKHKVLFTLQQLKNIGKKAILVSKDFVLRVKAESIGLHAEDYESLKEAYENMYKGIRHLELPKEEIDAVFLHGYLEVKDTPFYPNEYCILKSKANTSIATKYNPKTKRLEPLIPIGKSIWGLTPMNDEQRCAIDMLLRDDIKLVTFIGQAGTGKTLLALTCGLKKVFDDNLYRRILVSRPIMPLGKDIGYLPGTKEEKIYHWMQPIYDNLEFLCENTAGSKDNGAEAKNWILESEKIEMEAVTYIRGRSLSNTWIIIDEAQNLTPHEAKTIISRAGKGTKVILTGDPTQIDNPYLDKDSNAMTYLVSKFKPYSIYGHIFLERTERSELAALAADIL